jgi:hypothetical protein
VLLAEAEAPICEIYALFLGLEGHRVTAPDDFWGVLAVLRSTLHPVVAVVNQDRWVGQQRPDEERVTALEANLEALRRHRYVGISWGHARVTPRLLAIERALAVTQVLQPFPLGELAAAVARAAKGFPQ